MNTMVKKKCCADPVAIVIMDSLGCMIARHYIAECNTLKLCVKLCQSHHPPPDLCDAVTSMGTVLNRGCNPNPITISWE